MFEMSQYNSIENCKIKAKEIFGKDKEICFEGFNRISHWWIKPLVDAGYLEVFSTPGMWGYTDTVKIIKNLSDDE